LSDRIDRGRADPVQAIIIEKTKVNPKCEGTIFRLRQ
jgi:hypothetical protein